MHKLNLRTRQRETTVVGILTMLLGAAHIWFGSADSQATVLAATFIVMGFILSTYRHVLIVDADHKRVTRRIGCIYLFKRNDVVVSNVSRLTLRERRSRKSDATWYQIVASASKVICQIRPSIHARRIAEALAKTFSLSLDNQTHYVRSIRSPDQLDMPVAERWRAAGLQMDIPVAPPDTKIMIKQSDSDTWITLPAQHDHLKMLALLSGAFGMLAVLFYYFSTSDGTVILFVLFVPIALMMLLGVLAFSGRSSILLTGTHVTTRQGLSPFKMKLRLNSIEEFIKARDGFYLEGDDGSAWIHWAANEADSDYLEALLAYEIVRRTQ